MAVVEKTIGSGKDHATVALWESNVGTFGTDIYKGIIQENANFDENVTLTGSTGTPSITSYLWLTTDPANRHSGIAGTGHGRMYGTGTTDIITTDSAFCRVSYLDIKQNQNGSSDEGIHINSDIDDVLISHCIIWTDQTDTTQDGIYIDDSSATFTTYIDNCIIYGWGRCGILYQGTSGSAATWTLNLDHCTMWDNGHGDQAISGCVGIQSQHASDVIVVNLYNTWGVNDSASANPPFVDRGTGSQPTTPTGGVTWNGSNNARDDTTDYIQGTDNLTAWEDATSGVAVVTKSSGSWIVVNNITAGSVDLLLLDEAAGNLIANNGTDRIGSEPDTRQDFAIDITGGTRGTTGVDIGAHAFPAGGPDGGIIIQNAAP